MAGYAFPTSAYNSQAVTPKEYEDLVSAYTPDGIVGPFSLPSLVYGDGTLLGVKVRANRAVILRGLRWESGSTEVSVSVAANNSSGTIRKDLIVLRMSRNPWTVALAVVQGVAAPAATATTPSPTYGEDTSTGMWEMPLAVVTIPYNDTATDSGQVVNAGWWLGRDGQTICHPDARPPHARGRRIWEYTTGRAYISDGTNWVAVGEDSGDFTLTFLDGGGNATGWTSALNHVRRRNGMVFMQVSPQRTGANIAAGATVTLGTLPDGFRPPWTIEAVGVSPSGGQARLSVFTNGSVTATLFDGLATNRYLVCHPITFPAA